MAEWGIDPELKARGGLRDGGHVTRSARTIYLLQRKASKPGEGLGKTTGWIHRTTLRRRGVRMLAGVAYRRIDDAGLHIATAEGESMREDVTIGAIQCGARASRSSSVSGAGPSPSVMRVRATGATALTVTP